MNTLFDLSPQPAKIVLSYGLEALIAKAAEAQDGQISAETLSLAALRLYPEKVVQKGLEDLSKRFVKRVERLAGNVPKDGDESTAPPPKVRSLGSNLEDWSKTLDSSEICLFLSDFDPERSLHMYWWVEADLLEIALKSKLRFLSVSHVNHFEAAMYGFGGKYKDDVDGEVVAQSDAFSSDGANALKSLGF